MSSENPSDIIKKARPNIKDKSIALYVSNLNKLKKLFDTDNYDFLKDEKKVLDKLSNLSDNTIRNYLNACSKSSIKSSTSSIPTLNLIKESTTPMASRSVFGIAA